MMDTKKELREYTVKSGVPFKKMGELYHTTWEVVEGWFASLDEKQIAKYKSDVDSVARHLRNE